jgi:cytidylate kinase
MKHKPHGWTLALASIASGKTYRQAAEAAGVDVRTVMRWAQSHDWKVEMRRAHDRVITRAVSVLVHASTVAVNRLVRLAKGAKQEGTQLAACKAILELGIRYREEFDIRERLDALEEAASKSGTIGFHSPTPAPECDPNSPHDSDTLSDSPDE